MSGQCDVIDCTGMCLVSVMSSIVLGCDVGHEDFLSRKGQSLSKQFYEMSRVTCSTASSSDLHRLIFTGDNKCLPMKYVTTL